MTGMEWFCNIGRGEINEHVFTSSFGGGTECQSVGCRVFTSGSGRGGDLKEEVVGKGFFANRQDRRQYMI